MLANIFGIGPLKHYNASVVIDGHNAVTGGVNPRLDGEACAGEDRGAAEAPGLFDGMAIQNDGLSVVSSG